MDSYLVPFITWYARRRWGLCRGRLSIGAILVITPKASESDFCSTQTILKLVSIILRFSEPLSLLSVLLFHLQILPLGKFDLLLQEFELTAARFSISHTLVWLSVDDESDALKTSDGSQY
ncbi:MAG: hypothetical protein LUD17_05355 [Bacteroidales bacterium]|nr:hypothetical protein [Bacteroidales bacterium]